MTTIDVDTSPLQAAREWRGIGLVAVAMHSGLPVAQAEALEEGDPTAFGTIDEMIAAAVVYGASIGIGRDEAMALLDRTVTRSGSSVQLPAVPMARPNDAFSGAVQERSARIATRVDEVVDVPVIAIDPVDAVVLDSPVAPSLLEADLPVVPSGPTPEQAVAASGELHLDGAFGPDASWKGVGYTGELEAWVDDYEDADERGAVALDQPGLGARVGSGMHAAMERIVGTDRADAVADRLSALGARIGELARTGRERLRRSEHATLFVAIGAGAVLIAIVVALGGALGSDEPAGPGPATRTPEVTKESTGVEGAATAESADKPVADAKPMLPPARLKVDVFNSGSVKGKASTVAADLKAAGYGIGEVTNAKSDYAGSTIIHPADMAREARALARKTGITTLQVAPGSTRRITIVVT
jgi:hypothetical protein